jgi:prophage tail gpP-like protein
VVVQGHGVDGAIWEPNMLVDVDDDFNKISSTLLIRSVRFDQDIGGGETTLMDLTYRDAYQLQAEQTRRDALEEE